MKLYIPFVSILLLLPGLTALSQSTSGFKIAMERVLWHDNIDKQQGKLVPPGGVKISRDESVNLQITDALTRGVDELQLQFEQDSNMTGQEKIKYLRSLDFLLQGFNAYYHRKNFPPSIAPALVESFAKCVEFDRRK